MTDTPEDDGPKGPYQVGYGKPPKGTQFKPGQTGNPKGKPRGAKNLKTELLEELQEVIPVKEGGVRRKVSKQRAMLKSLTAKAVQGDPRAASILINLVFRLLHPEVDAETDVDLSAEDLEILKRFEDRVRKNLKTTEPTDDDG